MSDELKTPWRRIWYDVFNSDGNSVAECEHDDLAATIVHRVNCHDKIVEALEGMIEVFVDTGAGDEDMATVKAVRAALELAKGGSQ